MNNNFNLSDFCTYLNKVLIIIVHTKISRSNTRSLQIALKQLIPILKEQAGETYYEAAVREYERFIFKLLGILNKVNSNSRKIYTYQQAVCAISQTTSNEFYTSLANLISEYFMSMD